MEEREVAVIASDLWKYEMQWRADVKNAHSLDFEMRLYADLNALGYNVRWQHDMHPKKFNGDLRILPIFQKFIEEAEKDDELKKYRRLIYRCMIHKNFVVATEYFIKKYKLALATNEVDDRVLDLLSQAICATRDKRYISDYIELTNPKKIIFYSGGLIELLGMLKVYEAEEQILELLDLQLPPPTGVSEEYWYNMGFNTWITKCAIRAAGYLKSKKALPIIEKYLHPENLSGFFPKDRYRKCYITEVRKLAEKTIAKINQ